MAFIRGKKVLLEFYKDSSYTAFLCATECGINIGTATKLVTTIGDGIWDKIRGAGKNYRVTLSGLIELTGTSPVTFWLIENFDMQMLPVQFRMRFIDDTTGLLKIVTGSALIVDSSLTGVAQGFAGNTFEMIGDGAPVITDSALSCNATIGEITIGPGEVGQVSVGYEDVTNAARLEYSVDGGAREVIFDPGSSGFFFLTELSEGSHTITIWAVCESGVDGESNELIFEVDAGGEPGPTCSVPGTPVMSSITTTTATATWAASPSIPANGYAWEVLNGLTVIDSGATAGLSVGLTGLPISTSLTFRVKAICEIGVSESSFASVEFMTNGATCQPPTSLSVGSITTTTATASWTAASPVPGAGYDWYVIEAIGGTIVQSANTATTSVNLTSLTPATQYDFVVRSVCELGVDYSVTVTETFATM